MSEELFVRDEAEVAADAEINVEEMEVEDEVVMEIPVFLNDRVGSSLMLLQYPTRSRMPPDAAVPAIETTAVRVKKESEVVEVELNSGVPSNLINSNAGSGNMGLTQCYSGTIQHNQGRYAVGFMHNQQLHLSLVPQTTQLRPMFAHTEVNPLLPSTGSKGEQQPALKSVQMSVKSTSTEIPKHSPVLEFWRHSNKEEAVEFAPVAAERDVLVLGADASQEQVECKDLNSSMVFL